MRRAVVLALLAGVLVGLAAHLIGGVSPWWAVVLGLPAAGLVLLSSLMSGAGDANWEATPDLPASGAVLQASMLERRFAESVDDRHRFDSRVRPRLRAVALGTLRRHPELHGLRDLRDPRARELLGDDLHDLLTDGNARLPAPERLAEMLRRLERL